MAWLDPFEHGPHLAVGVSGGADSVCLVLLADRWARERGGRVTALTVDHGLRPESGAEAAQVARWMELAGIGHRTLSWSGPKPASAIQSAAREARYRLMENWCRERGVWHLLVGHHRDDQAETVALRFNRGSGRDGLAAMPALSEGPAVRLLRPLLAFPPERLKATLIEAGQAWIDDPSNRNERFARVRVRNALAKAVDTSDLRERLSGAASSAAVLRLRDEDAATTLLARACAPHPAGFAMLDRQALVSAPLAARRRALRRTILCVSGQAYAPRRDALDRLGEAVLSPEFVGKTLGGCHVAVTGSAFLVCREARNLEAPVAIDGPGHIIWDGRFEVETAARPVDRRGVTLGALGRDGWREIVKANSELRERWIPAPARWSLPAFRDSIGIFAVPHLGYNRDGIGSWDFGIRRLSWKPRNALSRRPLWLATREIRPI